MKTLFEILEGFLQLDGYYHETLDDVDVKQLQAYAEFSCERILTNKETERIIEVGTNWLGDISRGTIGWGLARMYAHQELDDYEDYRTNQ